ncbi:MAG: hypothetical protein WCF65_05205 [Parachlamydiaceae bacterium]
MNKYFSVTLISSLTLFCGGVFLFYLFFGSYSAKDKAAYEKMIHGKLDAESETTNSRQVRFGIQRDVSFKKNGVPHQFRVRSAQAELVTEKSHNALQVVENMLDVDCWVQERVDAQSENPEQVIIMLHAEKAAFYYQDDMLIAEKVNFSRTMASGTEFQEYSLNCDQIEGCRRLATGTATKAEVSLTGKKPNLIADQLKARIQDKKEIVVEADRAEYQSDELTLRDNVKIDYATYFKAASDRAIYSPGTVGGMAILYGNASVTTAGGDVIHAEDIHIDIANELLTCNQVDGILNGLGQSKTNFSSKKLVWNDPKQVITLSGDVKVSQEGVGKLDAADDVFITLVTVDGKKQISELETDGEAVLIHTDEETYLDHTLKCYGKLKVDHKRMELRMLSPLEAAGKVIEDLQVFFSDAKGKIYADKVFVKYEISEKNANRKITPVRIVLQGNVKITNAFAQDHKQYILADSVEIFPQTNEMTFRGSKEQRVLLYDQTNNLQISAPVLKITRADAVRREMVRGLGDVRLSFLDSELESLRRRFSLGNIQK